MCQRGINVFSISIIDCIWSYISVSLLRPYTFSIYLLIKCSVRLWMFTVFLWPALNPSFIVRDIVFNCWKRCNYPYLCSLTLCTLLGCGNWREWLPSGEGPHQPSEQDGGRPGRPAGELRHGRHCALHRHPNQGIQVLWTHKLLLTLFLGSLTYQWVYQDIGK